MRWRIWMWPLLVWLVFCTPGCGTYIARRIAQAPNTYPHWLAPEAPVELAFDSRYLTNFAARYVEVGPPPARLRFRVIQPADYQVSVSSTNWSEQGRPHFQFEFHATVPGQTSDWTQAPRGTVVLLHGYGLGQFAMAPWALRLAQDGWRCVLVDLRGHGKSTGRRIYFGVRETHDLSQLLNALSDSGELSRPVAAVGESYGAALALRWKTEDARVKRVVAIAPYANLSNAVLNIRQEYAGWVPKTFLRAGLNQLPTLLDVDPAQLNTTTVLTAHPVVALFVAGTNDKITPLPAVKTLYSLAGTGSELVVVPGATHEAVTYYFNVLVPPVLTWLDQSGEALHAEVGASPPEQDAASRIR